MRSQSKKLVFTSKCSKFGRLNSSTAQFVDSHIHLDATMKRLKMKISDFPLLTKKFGIQWEKCIQVCCDPNPRTFEESFALINNNENVFGAFGIHPHYAKDYTTNVENSILKAMKNPKCVAWGEIGLDYHYTRSPVEIQKEVFIRQLKMGVEQKKALVIHTREAEADTFEILKQNIPSDWPVHVHCFTSSYDLQKKFLSHFTNLYIGFTGIVTFDSARDLQYTVSQTPLERILLETDAPYLTPHPHRGEVCHSGYIPIIAQKIADIKKKSIEEVYNACRINTKAVYGI